MVAVICGPKYLEDIDHAVVELGQEIIYKKVDRDIDIMEEQEIIGQMDINMMVIDISCIEDSRKLPGFIRRTLRQKGDIRIFIIAPYSFSGKDIMNDLISMGIYDIIGQEDHGNSHILKGLVELYDNPSTYAKAVKWDKGAVNRRKQEKEFIKTGEGRFGKKITGEVITVEKDKIVGTVVIAVAGAMNRIGTTHTAISIGKYLLRNKHGVAIVELHPTEAFEAIKKSYENVEEKKSLFSLSGIDFYPYDPALAVSDLILGDYNYVILDMGAYRTCDIPEFKRAQERIIVSGAKDWELNELDELLKSEDKTFTNKYLFSFCDNATFQFVKTSMEPLDCYQAAYNPQPFDEYEEAGNVFEDMLSNVLPQVKEEKKGFLRSLLKKNGIKLRHKPILLKKAVGKGDEKEDFFKYLIVILLISILLIVLIYLVVTSPLFSEIRQYFNQLIQ